MSTAAAQKRPTNVSLSADLIDEAKALKVNVSKACEKGLREQVALSRAEQWREENREAIQYWNAHVDKHGLPLGQFRMF